MKKLAFILPILLTACAKEGCPNTWTDVADTAVTLFGVAAIIWAFSK